jgi:tRNA(Phe) wybutosine-synthesizing methylase Tyw3
LETLVQQAPLAQAPILDKEKAMTTPQVSALHYLSPEEERAIKSSVPYEGIEARIRGLVLLANSIPGIATLQSCAGHVRVRGEDFIVDATHVVFRANQEMTQEILFNAAPKAGIPDASLRYFDDGTFWIALECDPSESGKLWYLFRKLSEENAVDEKRD